jgi:hypothetical protein
MKKILVLILVILLQPACKSGDDRLATYTGGYITRTEFKEWLESRNMPVDLINRDKYAVSDYLCQIAVEKLTSDLAEKSLYNRGKLYLLIENTLYKNLLSTFYSGIVKDGITFNVTAVDISIIRLFTEKNGKPIPAGGKDKYKIILQILSELKSGADFNVLAKKYSEDAASAKNGRLGFIPEELLEKEIASAVAYLEENEYTSEPVILKGSLCLIKLHSRQKITEKNIANVITEKKNIEIIFDYYKTRALNETYMKIAGEKNIILKTDKSSFMHNKEVLFTIAGETFTTGELADILKLFFILKNGYPPVDEFTFAEKKTTAEKIFRERIIALEAARQGIESDSKFRRNWAYLKRAALSGLYKYNVFMKDINLTEKDILQEYYLNKEKKYYKIEKQNNKEKKIYLSYNEAKNKITTLLAKEKIKSLKKKWDKDILEENNYKLNMKKI